MNSVKCAQNVSSFLASENSVGRRYLQWRPEARLAQPANQVRIARFQPFAVSQLRSKQFALSGKRYVMAELSRSAPQQQRAFYGQVLG
jgi:hypothetical protein